MAALDKTYIDGREYILYRNWWIDNYDKMVKELGDYIWLYTFSFFDPGPEEVTPEFLKENTGDIEYFKNKYDFPIWNTSEKKDKWLVKNCDIQSFRERMLQVYSHKWDGFKGQKWVPKPKVKQKCNK